MHPIYRVKSFRHVAPYTLRIQFNDNTVRIIDFKPVLFGEIFEDLRDPELFKMVSIDKEAHTLIWPNGADFDPATLHDWHENLSAFTALISGWNSKNTKQMI
jgi:hypothetical protein